MRIKKPLLCSALSLMLIAGNAQINDSVFVVPDTLQPFSLADFYELILRHHPVARQAYQLPEVARQEIRLAQGNFDPRLETEYKVKHYNHTEYYRLFEGAIKLPTRSPVTPTLGVKRHKGQFINPQEYISDKYDYRQVYAGISIPLAQGLMTDERRTAIRQAELFKELLEADQIAMINKLLLDAAKDYWEWYFSFYSLRLADGTASIAEEIFRRTKTSFYGGERAAIDTVQARITLFERQVDRQEALTNWINQSLKLSTYLWDSLMNPVKLSERHAPVNQMELTVLPETTLEALLNQAMNNHPDLRKLNTELERLDLARKLASEYLRPKLDLTYYVLNQPFDPEGNSQAMTIDDNYQLGLDFSIPLFLRKERAKLAQIRLKRTFTSFNRNLAGRLIINDVTMAYNQLVNSGAILQQQRALVASYYQLMNAELINLENGESDLFKINVQQEKLFLAESKLIKTIAEYEKQKATLYWSAGVRPLP